MRAFKVVHDSLNYCGGAEKLSIETIRALQNLGFSVSLCTVEKTDWQKVRRTFGDVPKPETEAFLSDRLPAPRTYRSFLSVFMKKRDHSAVFNSNGDAIPPVFDDYTYVHFPPSNALVARDRDVDNVGLPWDLYFAPSRLARRALGGLDSGSRLLTNSEFSRSKIRKFWKRDAQVIYPPVDVETYQPLARVYSSRKNWVVTISRFDSVKNLGIVPWVASSCRAVERFVLIGSMKQGDSSVANQIAAASRRLGVKDKVRLMPNASNAQKHAVLSQAKVLFHPKKHEHFGISIVEGMAAGCIPVVFDSGGPVEFVAEEFRRNRVEDFPSLIDDAVSSWDAGRALELSNGASRFDRDHYQRSIEQMLLGKGSPTQQDL